MNRTFFALLLPKRFISDYFNSPFFTQLEQQPLDIMFSEGEEITFSVEGEKYVIACTRDLTT